MDNTWTPVLNGANGGPNRSFPTLDMLNTTAPRGQGEIVSLMIGTNRTIYVGNSDAIGDWSETAAIAPTLGLDYVLGINPNSTKTINAPVGGSNSNSVVIQGTNTMVSGNLPMATGTKTLGDSAVVAANVVQRGGSLTNGNIVKAGAGNTVLDTGVSATVLSSIPTLPISGTDLINVDSGILLYTGTSTITISTSTISAFSTSTFQGSNGVAFVIGFTPSQMPDPGKSMRFEMPANWTGTATVQAISVVGLLPNAMDSTGGATATATDTGLPAANAPRTVSFWMQTTQVTQGNVFAYGSLFLFYFQNPGASIFLTSFISGISSTFTGVNDGSWHHILAIVDGTNVALWIDGSLDSTQAWTPGYTTLTGTMEIGNGAGLDPHPYSGLTADVQIYDYTVTSGDVALIYAGGIAASGNPPIRRYALQQTTGTNVPDTGSQVQDATESSAAWNVGGGPLPGTAVAINGSTDPISVTPGVSVLVMGNTNTGGFDIVEGVMGFSGTVLGGTGGLQVLTYKAGLFQSAV